MNKAWNFKTAEEWNEKIHEYDKNITIVKDFGYSNGKRIFECKCSNCNQLFTKATTEIINQTKCPICSNQKIVKGINDIATTHPNMVKYFVDINDTYECCEGSTKSVKLECPLCHKNKVMKVYNLFLYGFKCNYCSDTISFPNKFARAVLSQLPITNFQTEYSPKWISPKKYDNYFEYNNQKYILEMDGEFHYIENPYQNSRSLSESKRADAYKDMQALNHNITMIRINCCGSDVSVIRQNIQNSELSKIFDLSLIDWEECETQSLRSLVITACELYTQGSFIKDIAMELHISNGTVTRYLKRGSKLGLVNYSPTHRKYLEKDIDIFTTTNIFVTNCKTYREARYYLQQLNPQVNYSEATIRRRCKDNNKIPYKGYIFVERD